jgi:hypothetical protein
VGDTASEWLVRAWVSEWLVGRWVGEWLVVGWASEWLVGVWVNERASRWKRMYVFTEASETNGSPDTDRG